MTKYLDGFYLLAAGLGLFAILLAVSRYFGFLEFLDVLFMVMLIGAFFEIKKLKKENQKLKDQLESKTPS